MLPTGGSVPKVLESHTKGRKAIRIIDIVRKENSMTEEQKKRAKFMIKNICPYCLETDCDLWEFEEDVLKCPI